MSISTFPAKPITLAIAMGIFLAGCGGRESRPVPATNVADTSLDCPAIAREFEANERQIVVTLQEKDSAVAKNVVLGVTGAVLFFPALFFMDPKSPEKVEIDALRNRNRVLEDIARTRRCPVPQTKIAEVYRRLDDMPAKAPQ
ncbi:MAG: hypothetical protein K0R61_1691 [Microvirga sp.]|jgi:hypothetical protein|nr:hypothetical protein [Microvirga sp.]MDF2687848.1 hypothetical protein [Microvirga sp.]MDF2971241.1 hypothetical protein [Microvirga sp.]